MNTKQLRIVALSLALLLPFSQAVAGCKGGSCNARFAKQRAKQVFAPAQAATPVAPVEAVKAATPAAQTDAQNTEANNEEEEGSWMPWIVGGGLTALAAVAAVLGYKYSVHTKIAGFFKKSEKPAETTPATEAPATPAA